MADFQTVIGILFKMTAKNQARLSALYQVPYEDLTPRQRLQRISLHELWMRELDDLIDELNHTKK